MPPEEMKALIAEARRHAEALIRGTETGDADLLHDMAYALEAALSPLPDEHLNEEGLAREMVSAINSEPGTGPGWTLTLRGNERMVRVCARAAMGEITPLLAEVRRLRAWRSEAMTVLSEWEATFEAAGSPGRLGQSKAVALREEVARLRALSAHPDGETNIRAKVWREGWERGFLDARAACRDEGGFIDVIPAPNPYLLTTVGGSE